MSKNIKFKFIKKNAYTKKLANYFVVILHQLDVLRKVFSTFFKEKNIYSF